MSPEDCTRVRSAETKHMRLFSSSRRIDLSGQICRIRFSSSPQATEGWTPL